MVQRITSDRNVCRPTGECPETVTNPSNDDSSRTRLLSGTENTPETGSVRYLPAFMGHNNVEALIYRLRSGELFQVTRTHTEPQRIYDEDALKRQFFRSSVDVVQESEFSDTASESGLSRGFLKGRRHGRTAKREGDSHSPVSIRRKKRRLARSCQAVRNSDHDSESEDSMVESARRGTELRQIRIDEAADYYDKTLRSINQLCCKDILKAWIRFCHPKKQSTHPYNGGKDKSPELSKKVSRKKYEYNGHFTKPDYWPCDKSWFHGKGARHLEPDHLLKHERLELFPHLLQYTNKHSKDATRGFSLENLIKSTDGIHLDSGNKKHWKPEYRERLQEIYWVRGKEMQYQRGEIDGDTLIPVHMPKPRRNARKKRKSAAKTAKPSRKHARNEPEESISTMVGQAPVANMCINSQIKDGEAKMKQNENENENERSKPSSHTSTSTNTSPLTEGITPDTPDESYSEPTLCNSTTMDSTNLNSQHQPLENTGRPQNSVEENWTMPSTSFWQDPTVSRNPSSSMLMQTSYDQRRRQQNDQASWQQVPVRTRQNETFTRSATAHPVTPEVENIRYPGFAASSSGLAGYSGWQNEEYLNPQGTSSVHTADADSNTSFLPYTYGSFTSDYSYATSSSGPQFDSWNDESQTVMPPYHQNLDEEQRQRFGAPAVGIPQYSYQHLGMHTSSAGNHDLAN